MVVNFVGPRRQDPSDPVDFVCTELIIMLLGCMPPTLTALLRANLGDRAPEPPTKWTVQILAETLHDNRHTVFHKLLSDRFFSDDLPFLRRLARDLDRGKERGRMLITKGELVKILDIAVRLVEVCSAAGFPNDRERALGLLRGFKKQIR